MKLPQIRMESNFIKLGLDIIKPNQSIEQPKADLSIEQPKAQLNIETTPSKLTIDQSEAWADMDLKGVLRRSKDNADYGYQSWLEGIGRRAQQGNELMQIEIKGNVIASQAKQNSEKPMKQFNIGWIPSYISVKTNYQPAKVNIEWKVNEPIIESRTNKPIHEYIPGKVKGNIEEWNSLQIEFIDIQSEN